jgi:hypothetical protein
MRLPIVGLSLLAAAGLLAGCDSFSFGSKSHLACPRVRIAPDLDRIVELGAGGETVLTGKLGPVTSTCKMGERAILVDVTLTVAAARGGMAPANSQLTYFFAVSDADHNVLNEGNFGWVPDLASGPSDTHQDKITVRIPTYDPASGINFDVFVGFRLTPEQLQYNRTHSAG